MKFRVITADCPWSFSDSLTMSEVARGAASNYPCLDLTAIKALPVQALAETDAVLGLWCPSSMLQDGLDVMKAWGFRQVQEWVWVKLTTNQDAEISISTDGQVALRDNAVLRALAGLARKADRVQVAPHGDHQEIIVDLPLEFGLGRLARSAKEVFLVGARGRLYRHLKDRSIRDVFFATAGKHSEKPTCFRDALDTMFPEGNRLEMFARRDHPGEPFTRDWTCVGNECPSTPGEDIRDSLKRLMEKP